MTEKSSEISNFIIQEIKKKARILDIETGNIENSFSLTGSGIFDSIEFMDLMISVENRFNVEVDFSEAEPSEFTTLEGFVNCCK